MSLVKDVAVVRSLQDMVADQAFLKAEADLDGKAILTNVYRWMSQFQNNSEEQTLTIKEAVIKLIEEKGFSTAQVRVPVGIRPLDDWTKGGLRTQQLGIIMMPSGDGKSATLLNMAYKAANQDVNVWFITNELSMFEQTERFLARMTGVDLGRIENDPGSAYEGCSNYWANGFDKHMWITSITGEPTAAELESIMQRQANIHGWKPTLIVLDYLERMRPSGTGYSREQEYIWLGAIAKDLVRMAKKHNVLVWSACQTNRMAVNAQIIDATMIQGSTRHLQEATALIAGRQVSLGMTADGNDERIGIEFFDIKARSAKRSSKSRIVETSLATMFISDNEVDPAMIHRRGNDLDEDEDEQPEKKQFKKKSKFNNGGGRRDRSY
jgi:replicative DNA helicase